MECRAAQLGLTGTSQLRQKLEYDGDQAAAVETGGYIECARLRGAKATLLGMKVGPAERPRG